MGYMSEEHHEFIAKLTDNARTSLRNAEAIARGQGAVYIGTEHILLGVLAQGSSVGAKILADMGVTLQRVESAMNITPELFTVPADSTRIRQLSETAVATLKMAHDFAQTLQQEYLGTEHILHSLLRQSNARATTIVSELNINVEDIIRELSAYLDRQQSNYQEMLERGDHVDQKQAPGILDVFGVDVTKKAREGNIDVVIGRKHELQRVMTILSRRSKNNPLLIGEPGVGKSAIVEGLACAIASQEVPEHLLDMRVIELDLASMVAGTKYRGEFEERLKKVIAEVRALKNVIIFVDEIHLLVGAGSAEGSMDAANILKPALARGDIRLVGATTFEEYRKYIEKDSALDRRFQTVTVREPTAEQTIRILQGLREYYEAHHGVIVSDAAIEQAVFLADRYIQDRFMPDKAIDVIDEAAATMRIREGMISSAQRDIANQMKELRSTIEDAVGDEDFERAALYKTRLSRLESQHDALVKKHNTASPQPLKEQYIAQAVADSTTVPVHKIQSSEIVYLKKLEKHLAKRIMGQNDVLKLVARAVRRGRSGVTARKRPIGSFVFLGPTGVGKTELARVLASEVFGSDQALIKIDMSEFGERHATAKLIGAPAGYVGYEDGGTLVERVRRQPYSVILFDEIEKAHSDVFQLLLQMLEDGTLTDSRGRSVSFANTLVILTSNLGAHDMERESSLGFTMKQSQKEQEKLDKIHQKNDTTAKEALKNFMSPELIQRFDGIVTFRALTRLSLVKIVSSYVDELTDRLAKQGYGLRVKLAAKRFIVEKGCDEKHGARPLRRAFEDLIEQEVAEIVLSQKIKKGDIMVVDKQKKGITVQIEHER